MPSTAFSPQLITPDFVERVRSVLSLPDGKLKAINKWAQSNLSMFLDPDQNVNLSTVETSIGVDHWHLRAAMSVITSAIFAREELTPAEDGLVSIDIEGCIGWLKSRGVNEVEKVRSLLEGISLPSKDAVYIPQKTSALNTVLPTLDDVDAICDLRAIFQKYPAPNHSESQEKGVQTLLGFEPIVLVGLELNDPLANSTTCNFQVSEKGLRALLKTLAEALLQVEIVKKKQASMTMSNENS